MASGLTQPYPVCGITLAPGETGTVIDLDPENGDLVIRLDRELDELDHRANLLCIPAGNAPSKLRALARGRGTEIAANDYGLTYSRAVDLCVQIKDR
jgi:hypothetical protein